MSSERTKSGEGARQVQAEGVSCPKKRSIRTTQPGSHGGTFGQRPPLPGELPCWRRWRALAATCETKLLQRGFNTKEELIHGD